MAGAAGNIRWMAQCHSRHCPGNIADIVGADSGRAGTLAVTIGRVVLGLGWLAQLLGHQRGSLGHVVPDPPHVHDVVVIGFAKVIPNCYRRRNHIELVATIANHVVRPLRHAQMLAPGSSRRHPLVRPHPVRLGLTRDGPPCTSPRTRDGPK